MSILKWLLFFIALFASRPVGAFLRRRVKYRFAIWTLLGFLPFFGAYGMGLVAFNHPGDTYGIEVGLVDWLALCLIVAEKKPVKPLAFRFALVAYLLVATISIVQGQSHLASFGYVWKLGRVYLLYAAIYRAGHDIRVPEALIRGLSLGVVYEAGWSFWQHFVLGLRPATGTFSHQNTLGMMVNMVVMAPIALFFSGRATRVMKLAPLLAVPICLFTVSRGALLFLGVGTTLVYAASALRKYSVRKALIGLAGVAVMAIFVPVALMTLSSRSAEAQAGSMEVRWQFERAASQMLADHPFGVGPNHYTAMLMGGYGQRAGVHWTQLGSIVHNIYLLTAAEMGYVGLVALIILFVTPVLTGLRSLVKGRRDYRGDMLLGCTVGLLVLYGQSFFEWVWRDTCVTYAYFAEFAMIGALDRQLRRSNREALHRSSEQARGTTDQALTASSPGAGAPS